MKYLKLAGASLNQTALDFRQNTRNIVNAIEMARDHEVAILCLPELAITGYGCEDSFFSDYIVQRAWQALEEIATVCEDIAVSVGLPIEYEGSLYNCTALIYDTQILGVIAKQELAGDGIYYEPRWFKKWPNDMVAALRKGEAHFPLGDFLFEIDGVRIGFEICEDAWNGERPAQKHYRRGVDLILNPSASNFAFGKSQVRRNLVTEASRQYNCTYVYSNLLGNDSGRIIFDGEVLIAQQGRLLGRNKRFSFAEYQLVTAVVDVDAVLLSRKKSFNFEPEEPAYLVEVAGSFRPAKPAVVADLRPDADSWQDEFYLAETLGLFDYMRKSRSRGFVLSLSGGADSSTCAVLVKGTFERALAELGEDLLMEKLGYARIDPDRPLVAQLFSCVYQATANSSLETLESARELATALGAEFHQWDVEDIHQRYLALGANAAGRPLNWEQDDISLQNIQARLRAPGVWLIANMKNALLLTTSNRSEAAVGYATMDGDTAGGLAPLGGIDKASIIAWLKWAETSLEIPALAYVNRLQPTAELRPDAYNQTDEQDLMPYDILELIEEQAIGAYRSPAEVFITLRGAAPDVQLKKYIRKFFTLWSRNQWKRERYAPSFHLDDKNLDPKTWCRFPILNGGFEQMLREMEEMA